MNCFDKQTQAYTSRPPGKCTFTSLLWLASAIAPQCFDLGRATDAADHFCHDRLGATDGIVLRSTRDWLWERSDPG